MVSLDDDAMTEDLFRGITAIEGVVKIVRGGEILTMIEQHPEYRELSNRPVLWHQFENEIGDFN